MKVWLILAKTPVALLNRQLSRLSKQQNKVRSDLHDVQRRQRNWTLPLKQATRDKQRLQKLSTKRGELQRQFALKLARSRREDAAF